MSDQISCTLRIFGALKQAQIEEMANILILEAEDLEDGSVNFDGHYSTEIDNEFENYAQDNGISFAWTYAGGSTYESGIDLYDGPSDTRDSHIWLEEQIVLRACDLNNPTEINTATAWMSWLSDQTFSVVDAPTHKTVKLTVVMQEVSTPFPPVAQDPLIYAVRVPESMIAGLTVHSFNKTLEAEILRQVALIRYEELDITGSSGMIVKIRDGMRVLFVFKGDLPAMFDFRK